MFTAAGNARIATLSSNNINNVFPIAALTYRDIKPINVQPDIVPVAMFPTPTRRLRGLWLHRHL